MCYWIIVIANVHAVVVKMFQFWDALSIDNVMANSSQLELINLLVN